MTSEEWQDIFLKEYLSIKDIQKLYDFTYQKACQFILDIKTNFLLENKNLRLKVQGKLHIQDYFDYLGITNLERYIPASKYTVNSSKCCKS